MGAKEAIATRLEAIDARFMQLSEALDIELVPEEKEMILHQATAAGAREGKLGAK